MDRYGKPGGWLRPQEHLEIWALEDGREVRLSRARASEPWTARWR
ncbi:hypothetical protein [Deinococcus hopiensis]|nr:hypothetical protein [Deinococcus hopiensis]